MLELVANFVPEAAVLSCGAAAAVASKACATRGACVGGVCTWELAWESAPALELSLPAADHGDFELRLVATATEPLTTSDQKVAERTASLRVTIAATAQPPQLTVSVVEAREGSSSLLSVDSSLFWGDEDASEELGDGARRSCRCDAHVRRAV